jgi:hypothetical protein
MTKTRKKTNMALQPNENGQVPYEITYQAIVDQKVQKLPLADQRELDSLLVDNRKDAEKAIPRLLALKEKYPKIPLLYNYLSIAYGFVDLQLQKQAITDNYQQNPSYLFARCHYAQHCLREGKPEQVPAIFDKKFDLKALYPRRNQFHATEYAAFSGVLCGYFKAIGDDEMAQYFYDCLERLVPNAIETHQAKKLMKPGLFSRLGHKIVSLLSN